MGHPLRPGPCDQGDPGMPAGQQKPGGVRSAVLLLSCKPDPASARGSTVGHSPQPQLTWPQVGSSSAHPRHLLAAKRTLQDRWVLPSREASRMETTLKSSRASRTLTELDTQDSCGRARGDGASEACVLTTVWSAVPRPHLADTFPWLLGCQASPLPGGCLASGQGSALCCLWLPGELCAQGCSPGYATAPQVPPLAEPRPPRASASQGCPPGLTVLNLHAVVTPSGQGLGPSPPLLSLPLLTPTSSPLGTCVPHPTALAICS